MVWFNNLIRCTEFQVNRFFQIIFAWGNKMNTSRNSQKNTAEMDKTRVLGYQVAKVLTDQELLIVSGALCQPPKGGTWCSGDGCNCTYEDDCK